MDVNSRIRAYLVTLYTASGDADVTGLVRRYLDEASGEMSARMQALIAAAVA